MVTLTMYGIVDLLLALMALYAIYLGMTLEQTALLWVGAFNLAVVLPVLVSVTYRLFRRYCRYRNGIFCPTE